MTPDEKAAFDALTARVSALEAEKSDGTSDDVSATVAHNLSIGLLQAAPPSSPFAPTAK